MARDKSKLGRPRTVKHGQKLNLYVDREIKRTLFAMATEKRVSISAVVRDLVLAVSTQKDEATAVPTP